MRKKKVLATTVLTAMAAMQLAMPVMAATTNNKKENLTDPGNTTLTDNLKDDGHTLFSVFETGEELAGQVSFTVPLYVTMAAQNQKTAMAVPEGYYIENNGNEPIGITGISVRTYGTWEIIQSTGTPADTYEMTFSLNKKGAEDDQAFGFPALDKQKETSLFSRTDWKTNAMLTGKENFFFSSAEVYGAPGFKKIIGKMELEMASKIKGDTRKDTTTVPAFQVTYTLSALDKDGQPLASTYVGDDRDQAMAEVIGVN